MNAALHIDSLKIRHSQTFFFSLFLSKVAFTLVHFTQYASSFHYKINIFAYLKHNNLLRKTDQCERNFTHQFSQTQTHKFSFSLSFSNLVLLSGLARSAAAGFNRMEIDVLLIFLPLSLSLSFRRRK